MSKLIRSEVSYLSPEELTTHPALKDFPPLSDDDRAVLEVSIKERGIQEPLIVQGSYVVDGRARLEAALAQGLPVVPVVVRDVADALGFAIESAIARRQLARSAIAFVLFEQHPELATARNKGGRPKNCSSGEQLSARHESYRQLGVRYRVPHAYFSYLAEMKSEATAEEWAELRRVILFEEASIPRQFAGFKTGNPAGGQRGPVVYAYANDQGILEGILPRAFSSVREGFSRWHEQFDSKTKAAVEREWAQLLDAAPPELLKIARRKAQHAEGRA